MGTSTFSGPVVSTNGFTGDVVGAVQVPTYTVATAPAAASIAGTVIYVTDGAAGSAILAFGRYQLEAFGYWCNYRSFVR